MQTPTQPQQSRRSFLTNLALVGVTAYVLFFGGSTQVKNAITTYGPDIAANVQRGAVLIQTQPGVVQAIATMPPAVKPASQPVVVVPQGEYHTQPTAQPIPTEIAPAVLNQGATSYALITTPPTPYPTPVCTDVNATFVTDKVRVLDEKGNPIGDVQGWSCTSQADAIAAVNRAAEEMVKAQK